MPDKYIRHKFHEWFKLFLENDHVSTEAFKSAITGRAEEMAPAYGIARGEDFGYYEEFVCKALAYNNKQYYIYRAIENPNKIGFLSRKQWYKLKLKALNNKHPEDLKEMVNLYLCNNGKMSSPCKLLKKALGENPRLKFLKDFFKLKDDGRCENEDKLIEFANNMLSKTIGLRMIETTVQDCYNMHLPGGYGGSGHRFATHSCMEGRSIGAFYNALPVHGMMIKREGEGIGRFLLWDLPDGRQYVDRLYCREQEAQACLELIDHTYPNALKYPLERESGIFELEFKDVSMFEGPVNLPYVDSFPFLHERNGKMFMCNTESTQAGSQCQLTVHFASTCNSYRIKKCPHCGKIWFGNGSYINDDMRIHKYVCSAYKPRRKDMQAYLKIYRTMQEQLGGMNNDTEGFVYEV